MSALRVSVPGRQTVLHTDTDPFLGLTQRQRQILEVVRAHNGNRSRAARELGVRAASVQATLRLCKKAGAPVPTALAGRRGRPDLKPRKNRYARAA